MDFNLIIFFVLVVIVLSVMMDTIKSVAKRQIAFKERQLELSREGGGNSTEASARLDNMEQRLRVLERIATDSGSNVSANLAREIEALRHEQDVGTGAQINLKEQIDVKDKVR